MKERFLRLLELLDLLDKKSFYQGELGNIVVNPTDDSWFFDVIFEEPLDIKYFEEFANRVDLLPKKQESIKKAHLRVKYRNNNLAKLHDYYDLVLRRLAIQKPRFNAMVEFEIEQKGNRIEVICPKDGTFVTGMLYDIKKMLDDYGFDVRLATRICEVSPTIESRMDKIHNDFQTGVVQNVDGNPVEKRFVSYNNVVIRGVKDKISDIPINETDLLEYKSANDSTMFAFEGEITGIEQRTINSTTELFTLLVSDDEDSIYVKKFVKKQEELEFMNDTKNGMLVKVKGNAVFDKFMDEVSVTAISIERTNYVIPKDDRIDKEKEKRIELHIHTKMSTLDGITSATEYVETAKKWGHKAIAITDHGNVQAYPELFKATKDKTVKPIYGAEFTFIDEEDLQIVKNPVDRNFDDCEFVVFDIETTGLSVNFDKIIEISAVKIKNNQRLDQFSTFVNPERPLSMFTTKLTSIRNQDVQNAPKIEEVIPKFKDFIQGCVMVAHNAHFDMGFIYQVMKENDIYEGPIPTIDTLQIARNCYGDKLKRFNLKAVSKLFKVHLEQHHRAIDDTNATTEVFIHMMSDARRNGVTNINNFNLLSTKSDAYQHAISKHINLLVKNEIGLKNLYTLTSLANTKYFYKEARLLKRVLNEYREGILVGTGCMNSMFFEIALNKNRDELIEYAKYYDFIELQPISDFDHLAQNMDGGMEAIKETFLRIIEVGKELDIPVVATGDVHHLLESDKKYRDIYVQTPVVGGGLHPLSRYDDIPSQYLRTTKEMLEEFAFLDEDTRTEIVITNTHVINDKIDFVKAFKPDLYSPTDDFLALEGIPSISNKLIKMVGDHSKELYGREIPKIVQDRIEKELRSIIDNKFSTVYYISHLLVKKSLDEGYLVGSRGSVGSSLVATLMDITEVNPLPPHYVCPKCQFSSFKMTKEEKIKYKIKDEELRLQSLLDKVDSGFDLPKENCPICDAEMNKDGHDIPFETFLGFKGDKVPDIDLNFSGDYQPVVHEYIRTIFGVDRAFRAGTISTVADKTAFGYVKGYLEKKHLVMRKAEIDRRSRMITGVKRSTGQHPGGIVVVPNYKEITDVTPVQYPADDTNASWRTTHFDYHSFEDNLFKLDVLGHDDPTMIRFLMDYVKENPIDFPFSDAREIPLDDPKVYQLLNSTEVIGLKPEDLNSQVASFGVPEMGTSFVRDMLTDSRPNSFADVVKISGLSHGTDVWLNNAKDLVTGKTRFGNIPFKEVIGCRDDIMVYLIQNDMKQDIAFEISEFIRRGRPSREKDKWEGYKLIMKDHNIPDWYIWSCGQIKYMFPKAHATAYVMMAMRIAWFKLYKPILFYSAYFSKRASDFDVYAFIGGEYEITKRMNEIDEKGNRKTDKEARLYTVLEIALEMVKRGFKFKNIDIQKSQSRDFIIDEDNVSLILPFITVDGLGLKAAEAIVLKREESGIKTRDDIKAIPGLSTTIIKKLDMLDVFEDMPDNSQINLFDFS